MVSWSLARVQTSQSDATRSVEECSWRFLRRLKTELSDCEVFGQFSWSFMKHHEQFRSCTKNRLYPTPNRNDIMDLVTYQTLSTTGMVNKENVTVTERTLCIKNCLLWRWDCDIKGMMTYQTLWPIGYVTQRADSNVSYTHYQRIICDDVSV